MEFLATPEAGLMGLFLAGFLAATVLPGGSEATFVALVLAHPDQSLAALLLATLGNTLGGMTTYALGRMLPQHLAPENAALAKRWGAPVLVLAWAPLVGDALCAAAGWLRLPWLPCLLWMASGKGARYALLLWATQ